jgi:hypothetical protein
MANLGFNRRIPENWNPVWIGMWAVAAPTVIVSAFFVSFWIWLVIAIVGFLVPELVSLVKQQDSLPPLTHTIRHFLPNWVAFPLIYFSLGSVGAHWLDFSEPVRIGLLMGLLGWLTDHFTVTYATRDPFPYSHRVEKPGSDAPRMPA